MESTIQSLIMSSYLKRSELCGKTNEFGLTRITTMRNTRQFESGFNRLSPKRKNHGLWKELRGKWIEPENLVQVEEDLRFMLIRFALIRSMDKPHLQRWN